MVSPSVVASQSRSRTSALRMPSHGDHRCTEYSFEHPSRTHPYDLGESCSLGDGGDSTTGETHIAAKQNVFRTRIPQVLANLAIHLLVLDLCMSFAFTTIVIAALLDAKEADGKEVLSINSKEASWLGSIAYICQPVGSVMSGAIVEFFGRKWSMIIVNAPFLLGWVLYSVSNSLTMLYVTNVILGIGIGFMEAPIMTYIAETCQPDFRALLTSLPGIMVQMSFFVVYLMGNVTTWRIAAGISASLPVITALYVTQMPETPIWLLSRGRTEDAERALCWLRGWVTPDVVKEEFNQLVAYNNTTSRRNPVTSPMIQFSSLSRNQEDQGDKENYINNELNSNATETRTRAVSTTPPPADSDSSHCNFDRWREMLRPPTLRPLMLVVPYFLVQQFAGMASIRPFMVHVFRQLGLDAAAEWTTVGSAVIGIVGAVCLVSTVSWLGKRFLSLVSLAGNGASCLLLGIYSFVVLRPGGADQLSATWLPLSLIIVLSFCSSVMFEIPWMMLSEVFPFRTRGIASGFSAAMCYVFLFVASKTYLDMEQSLHLHGVFFLFAAVNAFGFIFVYYRMPRMEGRSLVEIEEYFSGQNKRGFLKK